MSVKLASLIIEYAKELPPWQKILAKAAFEHLGDLSHAKEIDIAVSRFLKDSGVPVLNENAGDSEISYIDSLQTEATEGRSVVPRLIEISEYKNVNALSDGQKITFAPKLTIIYGENGAGKSGYNRVLNTAFYSRGDKNILPNILKPKNEQGTPTAKFEFEINGAKQVRSYPNEISKPEFKQFACFDSKTVPAHVGESNELYVLPKEMEFFDKLAKLIELVKTRIQNAINERNKPNEFQRFFDGESLLKEEIKAINASSEYIKISAVGLNQNQLKSDLEKQEKELNALRATDPKKKIAELKLAISECDDYAKTIAEGLTKCGVDANQSIQQALDAWKKAEENVKKSGAESFKTELIKTVGSSKWRQFIIATSELAKEEGAVLSRQFPSNGDSCPLCLQKLEKDALALFGRYFEFLGGQTEKDLTATKTTLKSLAQKYGLAPTTIVSKQNLSKWLDENNAQLKSELSKTEETIKEFFTLARERIEKFDLTSLAPVQTEGITEKLALIKSSLEESIKTFDEATFTKKQQDLGEAVLLLKHQVKFLELASEIEKYIKIQKWILGASAAIKTINPRPVTDKQKKIFNEYFTKEYQQKFFQEAQKLHVNFKIDIKAEGRAGKSLRKLDVFNHSPADVLSEGEQRAIALADFLTEIEICNLKGGIVFDDPVNSLDHERKLYIASRLVEESKRRQVVIFTHDVSFLFDLINEAEKQKFKAKDDYLCHWISKIDDSIGLVHLNHRRDLELDYKTHARAEELWQQARSETVPDKRELLSKQGFDCLRRTYEAFTLIELFGNTVRRFDRQIGHGTLKDVYCPRDVADFVSNKLKTCSGYVTGHLQADGYSGQLASPELLKQEIDAYIKFSKEYKERKEADKNQAVATQEVRILS